MQYYNYNELKFVTVIKVLIFILVCNELDIQYVKYFMKHKECLNRVLKNISRILKVL